MMTLQVGDLVEIGRIVDIDPVNGDVVVLQPRFISVRPDRLRLVERGSAVRRLAMQAKAFALRIRDCGLS
jgi:hypothetical protein